MESLSGIVRYVLRRFLTLAATLVAAACVVFFVMRVLPGDPAALTLGTGARPDTTAALRHQLGLDHPLAVQFAQWLGNLVTFSLGQSYTYQVPVAELIGPRLGVTGPLAFGAIAISTGLAIPSGVLAASRRGRAADALLMATTQIAVAIPNFWLGLLLILLFAIHLVWLPSGGFPGWSAGIVAALRALVLPALALALPQAAILARVTRAAVADVLQADFVRTARARGASRDWALWRHAVPNALIPIVTIIGLQFSFLLAGTVVVEQIFALPGIGRLLFQAVEQRDFIVVQDLVVLLVGTVIVANFLTDLLHAAIDPRLRG